MTGGLLTRRVSRWRGGMRAKEKISLGFTGDKIVIFTALMLIGYTGELAEK